MKSTFIGIMLVLLFWAADPAMPAAVDTNQIIRVNRIALATTPSPTEEFAARELASYCRLQTGLTLQSIRHQGDAPLTGAIALGRAGLALLPSEGWRNLGEEGFIIKTWDSNLVIAGVTDTGTLYGIYRFLNWALGLRWYAPGDLGLVRCPLASDGKVRVDQGALLISPLDHHEIPDFHVRFVGSNPWATFNGSNLAPDLNHKNGRSPVPLFKTKIFHTFGVFLDPEVYYDEHPEYYPLIGGVRRKFNPRFGPRLGLTYGNQICTSNPHVVREVARNISAALDDDPSIKMVALSPNDRQGFCECDACMRLDEPTRDRMGRFSRRILIFYNEVTEQVAKSHPDVIILGGAYGPYTAPPKDSSILLHPNLAIILAHFAECQAHPIADPTCPPNRRFVELLREWKKRCSRLYIYEYYYKVNWLGMQWPIVKSLTQNIKFFKSLGIAGLFSQYSAATHWALLPNYYTALALLWNADTDLNRLWQDLCIDLYGMEAARPMRLFHQTLEKAMASTSHHFPGGADNIIHVLNPYIIQTCEDALMEAKRLARGSDDLARISKTALAFDYTKKVYDYMVLKDRMKRAENVRLLNTRVDVCRERLNSLIRYLRANRGALEGIVDIKGILENPRGFYLAEEIKKIDKIYDNALKKLQ